MKIVVCGRFESGKDEFCKHLGVPYKSSSETAMSMIWDRQHYLSTNGKADSLPPWDRHDDVYAPFSRSEYANRLHSLAARFEILPRVNKMSRTEYLAAKGSIRPQLKGLISAFNGVDPAALAKLVYHDVDVYCGMREIKEFEACKDQGMFDLSIWIDRSTYDLAGQDSDCEITPLMCDITIPNNGNINLLWKKAQAIGSSLWPKTDPIQERIHKWANKVYPDRTAMDAFNKMVYEEIPEYVLGKDPEELFDIGIMLFDLAEMHNVDLIRGVTEKHMANEKAVWKVGDNGIMKRVKKDV